MEPVTKLTWEQLYKGFSKYSLSVYKANFLLENIDSFPNVQKMEVEKMRILSKHLAKRYFEEIQKQGIPETFLSAYLNENLKWKKSNEENELSELSEP